MQIHSPNKPKKFKPTLSACEKADGSCFSDRKGVLMVEFMQQSTIMSKVYCETLKKLCRAIENKRCGMLTSSVLAVLLHDNAYPRTDARTRSLLEHFNWELFDHPSYSPDLTPSDYLPEELVDITELQQ
jgi:hypothetical protein